MNRIKTILYTLLLALPAQRLHAQDIDKILIDIDLKNATLTEALNKIESLTPFKFTYRTEDLAGIKNITYHQQKVSVKKILADLLANTPLHFDAVKKYILITATPRASPKGVTLYGFIKSEQSGETMAGATISLSGRQQLFTSTNSYGFYSITVPQGDYTLNYSYIGYTDVNQTITLKESIANNIELSARSNDALQAVTVATAGNKSIVRRPLTGAHRLDIAEIKKLPMVGGEPDVLKSLQFLPGIQASNEGTTNLSVRGGSWDQNLILLDEAPVYNPSHTLGFFSTFNTDAIKDVSIYKSVYPAQYGGRLSSVVDVRMKEGNSKQQTVSGGIGLLASRLTWEGPLKKDQSSFMVSGRYSDIGALLNASQNIPLMKFKTTDSRVSFYDFNAKFNPILGNKDRLFLSAYTGHDNFYLDVIDRANRLQWGNTTVSARWNHVFNPSFFANTSLLFSEYRSSNDNIETSKRYTLKSRLREITLKTDMEWMLNSSNLIKFGAGITGQQIEPGAITPHDTGAVARMVSLEERRSAQINAYLSNDQKFGRALSISYGIRATGFASLNDNKTNYFGAEPRATARLLLANDASIKLSAGRNYQFQHLLTNSSVGLPTDIWIPSDQFFKPQYSDEFAAGAYKTFANGVFETSLEAYYRQTHNIIDFKDNAQIFLTEHIEDQTLTGRGKSYGLEFMLKKTKGRTTGWVSYTLSKALRQIDGVNDDQWYPPGYDHRHNLSFIFNQTLNKRLSVSANWVYRSGGFTTLPAGSYMFQGNRFLYYTSRNGYALPAYHRLDLSLTLEGKNPPGRRWQGQWVLSVYNVYNRDNIFALYVRQQDASFSSLQASKVYLVGILPTITYNFKF